VTPSWGWPRHAASLASPSGITLSPGSTSPVLPSSPNSPTSSAVVVSPPETSADPKFCPDYHTGDPRFMPCSSVGRFTCHKRRSSSEMIGIRLDSTHGIGWTLLTPVRQYHSFPPLWTCQTALTLTLPTTGPMERKLIGLHAHPWTLLTRGQIHWRRSLCEVSPSRPRRFIHTIAWTSLTPSLWSLLTQTRVIPWTPHTHANKDSNTLQIACVSRVQVDAGDDFAASSGHGRDTQPA
jgi:hypothetical protein